MLCLCKSRAKRGLDARMLLVRLETVGCDFARARFRAKSSMAVRLRSCASGGDEDIGEARRAVAQFAEDRRADEAPQPVARDFAEEIAQPPAIKAKVHEPCGDIDEV